MKKLFSILAAVMILAATSFSTKAQTISPEYKESVSELLTLTNTRQLIEETVTSSYNNMGLNFTIPTSQVVNTLFNKIWDRLLNDYANIYSKYYTLDEIKQLCEFYKTPLGKKFTIYSSDISRDTMGAMQKYNNDITKIISKYLKK